MNKTKQLDNNLFPQPNVLQDIQPNNLSCYRLCRCVLSTALSRIILEPWHVYPLINLNSSSNCLGRWFCFSYKVDATTQRTFILLGRSSCTDNSVSRQLIVTSVFCIWGGLKLIFSPLAATLSEILSGLSVPPFEYYVWNIVLKFDNLHV